MNSGSESNYNRRWWRTWYCFFTLALAWLAWCGWLARPLEPWAQGWAGWWTGDRMGTLPLWSFHTHILSGSEITRAESDAAFRMQSGSSVNLGHWREKRRNLTWAGWIRFTSPENKWPDYFLSLREVIAPEQTLQIGVEGGRPKAVLEMHPDQTNRRAWYSTTVTSSNKISPGEWTHLSFSTDGRLLRLTVNGRAIGEFSHFGHSQIFLAKLSLENKPPVANTAKGMPAQTVEQDDVVLFDRVVPPEELADLAAGGRGAWAAEVDRPVRAGRWWSLGWPIVLLGLVAMIAIKLLPRALDYLAVGVSILVQPGYQAVRWTLVVGLLLTALLTVMLAGRATNEDNRHFNEILSNLRQNTVTRWENVANLLSRAKDWIAGQTNLTLDAWNTWLLANRFPQGYPGVIGAGYAQQVLPKDIPAHEAEWSTRHGFAYRVHPGVETERRKVRELEGDPRLPVVLYETRTLDRSLWLSNHTILGRDLLFQALDDPRPWAAARRLEEVAARNEVQTSSMEEIAPAGWYGKPLQGIQLYVPWTLRTKAKEGAQYPLDSGSWRGVTFANVDTTRMVRDLLGTNDSLVGFRIFTSGTGGEKYDLVSDSGHLEPTTADRSDAARRGTLAIPFFYRRLLVEAWTTPAFDAQSMRRWPWMTTAAGSALTLLAACLLFVQVRAREAQGRTLTALHAANSELLQAYRERENLSRDLHDGSIQNLYALGLQLQRVQKSIDSPPDHIRAELQNSLTMLDQSIAELRQFILSAGIDNLGKRTVASALKGLIERLRKSTETEFDLQLDAESATLPAHTGVQLLNIVREGISNALRHAKARRIAVSLKRTERKDGNPIQWSLSVTDDGCGFDPRKVNGPGRGLKNLLSRATELGGRCDIHSAAGTGTRVVVEFPCTSDESKS